MAWPSRKPPRCDFVMAVFNAVAVESTGEEVINSVPLVVVTHAKTFDVFAPAFNG